MIFNTGDRVIFIKYPVIIGTIIGMPSVDFLLVSWDRRLTGLSYSTIYNNINYKNVYGVSPEQITFYNKESKFLSYKNKIENRHVKFL